MCDFSLPARLDHLTEEISSGAIFKNLDNDRCALFVDWMDDGENLVVVMPPKDVLDKKGRLPKPSRYVVTKLAPDQFYRWLVLSLGSDMLLIP